MDHNDVIPSSLSRRTVLTSAALTALLAPVAAGSARADGTFPGTGNSTPLAAIRSYADMVKALRQMERSSRFGVTVRTLREVGTAEYTTEQGRDLYVATVGSGSRQIWLHGRIHGNEPFGVDSSLAVLKELGSNGSAEFRRIRSEFTVHVIPLYNPDGSEMNIRHTILWDEATDSPRLDAAGREQLIDLNRDWKPDGFVARESRAWYEYWTMVKPEFALDIHHQGLKTDPAGNVVTMSLGISLAPGGPTLPTLEGGAYDVQTRQMHVHIWDELKSRGFIAIDHYDVGAGYVIDIRGGVVSAMMMGLNWNGLNPTGHSNPAIFFETSGNTREGSIGQKARGKFIQQNILGIEAWLDGLATGEIFREDPARWWEIPHAPVEYYFTDWHNPPIIPV